MALKLKKLGHKDLTIFEKSDRVGGKAHDTNYRNTTYFFGAVFVEPSYFDNLVALTREYIDGEITTVPEPEMWLQNRGGTNISLPQYYILELSKFTNTRDPLVNAAFLVTKLIKYIGYSKH